MHCPACKHDKTAVVDSRPMDDAIRRRRECEACGHRFSTVERIEHRLPLVVKKDDRRESYDREKVMAGLRLACRKRPVSAPAIDAAVERIEAAVVAAARGGELSSSEVGRLVLAELKELDLVGYLRFASVYQEVESAHDFLELLRPWVEADQASAGEDPE